MKITCFMMMSLDGRIDCAMTEKINGSKEYYEVLDDYSFDSYLTGKVTAKMHYASGDYIAKDKKEVGRESVFISNNSKHYAIITDTYGSLKWDSNKIDNDDLLIVLSENASLEYLNYLCGLNISYIVAGKDKIDLNRVVTILEERFDIKSLGILGGGNINGAFLECSLIDEVSVIIGPGIDGRGGMTSLFDGINIHSDVYNLKLKDLKKYNDDAVLLKYDVLK